MNQSRRGVAIAHLGRDLMLVGDEERPRQRRIVTERPVYRARGARSDARQNVDRRLMLP